MGEGQTQVMESYKRVCSLILRFYPMSVCLCPPPPETPLVYPSLAAGWKEQAREVTSPSRFLKTVLKQATKEVTGTADPPSPGPGPMT